MIFYLNSYADTSRTPGREVTVAANSKISYILSCIPDKYEVTNLSLARSMKGRLKEVSCKSGNLKYVCLSSPSVRDKKQCLKLKLNYLRYLLINVRKGDMLIVYHSLFWVKILKILKKIKQFTFVLELNDFYRFHYDGAQAEKVRQMEEDFFQLPDAFILANPDMLRELGDTKQTKPCLVNYGAYRVSDIENKKEDSIIRVLYSGAAEKLRGAAYLAAASASFMESDYELHLACYGTKENLSDLKKQVEESNKKGVGARIVYHGTLDMKQLSDLMSSCDIALSCHSYTDEEIYKAMFSFPSKIPLNMGSGLYIVSPHIPAFVGTPFDEATFYFDDFNPESVAAAVMEAGDAIRKNGSREIPKAIVRDLDTKFKADIRTMLAEYLK